MYNNNDQHFNRHNVLMKVSLVVWYIIDFVLTTYILISFIHVCVKLNSIFDSEMKVYYVTC